MRKSAPHMRGDMVMRYRYEFLKSFMMGSVPLKKIPSYDANSLHRKHLSSGLNVSCTFSKPQMQHPSSWWKRDSSDVQHYPPRRTGRSQTLYWDEIIASSGRKAKRATRGITLEQCGSAHQPSWSLWLFWRTQMWTFTIEMILSVWMSVILLQWNTKGMGCQRTK